MLSTALPYASISILVPTLIPIPTLTPIPILGPDGRFSFWPEAKQNSAEYQMLLSS